VALPDADVAAAIAASGPAVAAALVGVALAVGAVDLVMDFFAAAADI
jgi:hypothetical protein